MVKKRAGSGLVEARSYCDLCRASNEPCPPASNKFTTVILGLNGEMKGESVCVKTKPVQSEPTRLPIEVKDNKEKSKNAQSLDDEDGLLLKEESSKRARSLDNENALFHKERQQKPHSQPVPDPFWRGSLINEKISWKPNIGLVAHLSTLASSKLCNATNSLPELLRMEILPRLGVWPKRFGTRALEDDTGIYFFPEKKSCEKDFDDLLNNMIFRDAAVKTSFDFADLLIFTSLQLPLQHQKYQNKHYLWGLFSREKISSKSIQKVTPGSA